MRKITANILIVCTALIFIGKLVFKYNDFGIMISNAGCSGILIIIFLYFLVTEFQMMNSRKEPPTNRSSLIPYQDQSSRSYIEESIRFEVGDTIVTEDESGQKVGVANRRVKISKIGRR